MAKQKAGVYDKVLECAKEEFLSGRKTAGCPSFLPTAVGTASLPPSADGESPC